MSGLQRDDIKSYSIIHYSEYSEPVSLGSAAGAEIPTGGVI